VHQILLRWRMGGVLFWISSVEGDRPRSMLVIPQTRRCCDAVLDRQKLYSIGTWNSPSRYHAMPAHAHVLARLFSSSVPDRHSSSIHQETNHLDPALVRHCLTRCHRHTRSAPLPSCQLVLDSAENRSCQIQGLQVTMANWMVMLPRCPVGKTQDWGGCCIPGNQ